MKAKYFGLDKDGQKPGRRPQGLALVVIVWTVTLGLLLATNLGSAYAASPTTTAPPTTNEPATTVATTVPTTGATTVPTTTATTSVTTTTEPSTTTTTASSTSTTKRRVVVGIAVTRGLVVTEKSGNAQSGWIAFGILLVVVLGVGVGWWVHERRRQEAAKGTNKPPA
jgi:uncharacterized protein HemX